MFYPHFPVLLRHRLIPFRHFPLLPDFFLRPVRVLLFPLRHLLANRPSFFFLPGQLNLPRVQGSVIPSAPIDFSHICQQEQPAQLIQAVPAAIQILFIQLLFKLRRASGRRPSAQADASESVSFPDIADDLCCSFPFSEYTCQLIPDPADAVFRLYLNKSFPCALPAFSLP